MKIILETVDFEISSCDSRILQKSVRVGLCGSMKHRFVTGRDRGHGRENNAPKATQNSLYLIDIIRLF